MNPLDYLHDKFNLCLTQPSPIEIPNVGREMLGTIFRDLGYQVGAEIGVFKGEFASIILRAHPTLEYFCIDAWEDYDCWRNKFGTDGLNLFMQEAQERLKAYNVHFYKQFSSRAVKHFKDESLDFVYIDANHDVPWVFEDILQWSKKVRPGGIVSGHDYTHAKKGAHGTRLFVRQAVGWYTELKPVKTWFLLGRDAKIPGEIRDTCRSWFWVKE